ncbi:ComEC/Rec2 family competence protein [Caldilinea sp.]|uniref:ComEC/Rec2 family competence protein n=1 Tax=Caldilinea sp. TaxID=2293560 RepID=UPI002D110E74|nr:ComEC/Rec2 family competence protein [Anaerolineales bacterium]HQY93597.1 ComEC/Rec2 family competence protein [Caldilinea sp.]HRA66958.1 ComEC/Rec2 family competence protein [Caldilinea sp.]
MALLYLSLAYMLGILLGRLVLGLLGVECALPGWLWLLPLALLPLTPLLTRKPNLAFAPPMRWPASAGFEIPLAQRSPALAVACVLCLAAGALRYAGQPLMPCWTANDLAYYNLPASQAFERRAPQVTVTGVIDSYPLVADVKQNLVVKAGQLEIDGHVQPVSGQVRLSTGIRQRYAYGQPVRVTGRLVTPPEFEDFSYKEYLARKGIHSLFYSALIEVLDGELQGNPLLTALYTIRRRGEIFLNRALPEPYAGLANGMILGIESGIPDELYDQFNATGSSHVIVISGSNVALIAGVIMALMVRLVGGKRAVWFTVAGIACYALLVGGDAAVMRAAGMGSLAVIATGLNRRSTGLVSLGAACALMTLLNPLTLWDVGLQLSSAATAGLMIVAPGMIDGFRRLLTTVNMETVAQGPVGSFFEESVMVTLAANITTLPLVVYYFGRLSIVSLLTNVLILPAQPPIMLAGSAGVVAGMAGLDFVGRLILALPWLCLAWTVNVVQWTAALPGASLEIAGYGLGAMGTTYAAIVVVKERSRLQRLLDRLHCWAAPDWWGRLVSPVAASGLAMTTMLAWTAVAALPDGQLHLWFLDVGQGDGILIQTPSGRQVLIDGGASPEALFSELGAVMPFWDRTLDLLVLTHPDGDHMLAQAELPARYQVTAAVHTAHAAQHPDEAIWRERMADGGVRVTEVAAGAWLDLGDGVALWVLWPTPNGVAGEDADNENSLMTKLVYGDFSALLTGDAGVASEHLLVSGNTPLTSTLLKAGHHGSRNSSSHEFIEQVAPPIVVIQVGAENDYGHPHAEVLAELAGRTILRNDLDGRIHLWSDGQQLRVEKGRQ